MNIPVLIKDLGMEFSGGMRRRFGIFKCECGKEFKATVFKVKSGHTKSCGCYKIKVMSEAHKSHGLSKTRTYKIWKGMRQRCENTSNHAFNKYGGRGIIVCDRWKNSYPNFLEDMGECPKGLSLDRIDNNGNYEPNNCKWATRIEQSNNRKTCWRIISDNAIVNPEFLAKRDGVTLSAIHYRLKHNHYNAYKESY